MQKKDNSIFVRFSDDEMRQLNDGWFRAVGLVGRPVTKSEYIRACIRYMDTFLQGSGIPLENAQEVFENV